MNPKMMETECQPQSNNSIRIFEFLRLQVLKPKFEIQQSLHIKESQVNVIIRQNLGSMRVRQAPFKH